MTAAVSEPARHGDARLFASIAVGCGALAVGSLLAVVITDPGLALSGHAYEDAMTAVVWASLSWLLGRATTHPIVRIFLVAACCSALALAAGVYGIHGGPGSVAAAWLGGWIWAISTFVPVTLLPACFPSGRLREHPVLSCSSMVALIVVCSGLATSRTIDVSVDHTVENPLAVAASDALFVGGSVLIVAVAVAALITLWRRTNRSERTLRRQLAPVAVAASVTLPVLLLAAALPDWNAPIQLLVAPLVPGAMTLSILQFRLYDVEVVIRRSLVLLGLTVLVVGGYVLLVQAVANLSDRRAGPVDSVVATAVVALVFAPARAALQRAVGRWVYGDRDTPERAVADIGGLVSAEPDAGSALESATTRLREALRVPWIEVRAGAETLAVSGSRPRWAGDDLVETLPLVHLGVVQGELRITPRTPYERPDARDRALLTQLVALLASVLAGQRLVGDLRRSREAVVLAREEERRRVRRDLHDGIGPLLSTMATHADVGRLRLRRDPATVPEVLDRIHQLADDAVTGLRRVVDDLAPVAFDEVDLTTALDQLAATLSTGSARVRLDGAAGSDLPAAVEVAAYRITAEAVSNALRHSGGANVAIRLDRDEAGLRLTIADDGAGIWATATPGVGLASMRERADDLGAQFTVASSPAGTKVTAHFPLHRRPDAGHRL